MAIYLALDARGNLCTPSQLRQAIDVYDRSGELRESITHGVSGSPSGILVDRMGAIYLPLFHEGKLLKIELPKPTGDQPTGLVESIAKATFVAEDLGITGGVAKDSQGRIYVPDFNGDCIWLIY